MNGTTEATLSAPLTCLEPGWDEADRLAALDRYAILDTGREAAFDDVAELAADLLDAPIAVVNFIASERQWFKAEIGIGKDELPLDVSICRHAILRPGVFVVPDLTKDARFEHNPLVDAAGGLRFYAGALLETPDGLPLGTVCVLDTEARPDGISARQERALKALAAQTMAHLELRRSEAIARAEKARAEKHSRRLSLLADASARLLTATDPASMIRDLYGLIADDFRLDVCFHYACADGDLRLVASAGLTPEQEIKAARIEFGQTICGIVAKTREAVHLTGIQASDDPHAAFLRALGIDTYKSAPLVAHGELLGTLSFGREGGAFSPGELEVLRTLTAHVATALERHGADRQVGAAAHRQAFRLALEERLRDRADADDILAAAVAMLGEHLGADRVGYSQVRPDDRTVRLSHCRASGVEPLYGDFPLDSFGPASIAAQRRGETQVCPDVLADADQDPTVWAAIDTRAFVSVPLVREGRFRASLYVNSREPRRWSADDIALVEDAAARTWAAVERARAEATLRETTRRLDAILDNTREAVFLLDQRQHCVYANAAAEALTGYPFAEMQGRPLHDVVHHKKPDGSHYPLEECPIDRAFPERAQMSGEEIFVAPDGSLYPVAFTASPVLDEAGDPIGTVIEARNIEEEKAAERRRCLLIDELNHRAKNVLAIVQGVAAQTLKGADPAVREALEGRLAALAAAHNLLTRQNWETAPFRQVVDDALAPHAARPGAFEVEGPDLPLEPKTAVSLALALHELATNAVKYGALSAPEGRVEVRWRVEEDRLKLVWRERGGPPVAPPASRGFGSRMLERGLSAELGGAVKIDFQPQGVVCTVDAPLPQVRR